MQIRAQQEAVSSTRFSSLILLSLSISRASQIRQMFSDNCSEDPKNKKKTKIKTEKNDNKRS